jgi:transcription-repair coupling factor (superfamily II helicase)
MSLLELIEEYDRYKELVRTARQPDASAIHLTGLHGSLTALVLASFNQQTGKRLLIICDQTEAADQLADDFRLLLGEHQVALFGEQRSPGELLAASHHGVRSIESLRGLTSGDTQVVLTHFAALQIPLPAPHTVEEQTIRLTVGKTLPLELLIPQVRTFGFQRVDVVQSRGDYAVRGGIVDVFPFVGDNPLRIEYFGDTIESLREFDPVSQRSIRQLSTASIVPDVLGGSAGHSCSLLDYMDHDGIVALLNPESIDAHLAKEQTDAGNHIAGAAVKEGLQRFRQLHIHAIHPHQQRTIDFKSLPQPAFNGSVHLLKSHLHELQVKGYTVVFSCDTQSELARIRDLVASPITEPDASRRATADALDTELDVDRITFAQHTLHEGFVLPDARLAVYTEHQVFNRLKRRGRQRKAKGRGLTAKELTELRRGDYVVHMDFGIGRFDGLQTITVRNAAQEAARLRYADNDVLYVNLNYITKLQKYSSKEGHTPVLTRLGSRDWERLKERAKKRIKDIARDLIKLYAQRRLAEGHAFQKDHLWQKEMEAAFMYEDTFDQARATAEVKSDMETPHPMDRLVCGDVGFGKTEVAVRAAFKAVLDGKQVAMLVPTTILALQHYNTFLDRMSRYAVNVHVLSRFQSRKEQLEVIRQLTSGEIDIIIGTHRLLSKDVAFRDLGLLIIDEEHRFGVAAKEKLRQLRVNVDTLTLTATPIPRTLHFSLMGVRDISIIATPPKNRLPVHTEITRWSEELLREAVLREIGRNGQVYYVHDRVENIDDEAIKLGRMLPGVRIRVAHGQMPSKQLEETMLDFLERRFDVLVCTKIIESGLDIPNVNTIIINRADRFGMAELHQLRGRVGRSNVQAYAYLLIPPVSMLNRPTIQRLQAIEEFTDVGSGFSLAMRDLEIRGAGDLLGAEQSGFIDSMGFEAYTRVLEEAVNELREREFKDMPETPALSRRPGSEALVETEFDALIPREYVGNDTERLQLYRRMYTAGTFPQVDEIAEELKDRFGAPPMQVSNLLGVVRLRIAIAAAGFPKALLLPHKLELTFPPESDSRFYESPVFQDLMSRISLMKKDGTTLVQHANELKLVVAIPEPDATDHFPWAISFVQSLVAIESLPQSSPLV